MDRTASELCLATLFLRPTPERQVALGPLVQAVQDWAGLLDALEAHGVLGLFRRNLEAADVELPASVASALAPRAGRARDAGQRARLSVERISGHARGAGLDVTLRGEAVDLLELYEGADLRAPGVLDLHATARELRALLKALPRAGFLPEPGSLPTWWYRRLDLPVPLAPASPFLSAVRLHGCWHHPSLLIGVHESTLDGRRRRLGGPGVDAAAGPRALDPLDHLLDVTVELATHAGETLRAGRRTLLAAAARPDQPLRLGRVLDLHTRVETRCAEIPVDALLERAREWNAEAPLQAALECLQTGLGLEAEAREWARRATQALARTTAGARPSPAFRPDPIERLPQWVRPESSLLQRRHGSLSRGRVRHGLELVRQASVAGLGWPIACLQRRLERQQQAAAWDEARRPDRLADVTAAWRAAQRAEEQSPIRPRTLSLPVRDPHETRLPDHYAG